MKQRSSVDELVAEFAQCVASQNEAIKRHDSKSGNSFAKRYMAASKALLSMGPKGINAFSVLLEDPRLPVRTMAACDLLPFRTTEALEVLEESAKSGGITGLGAMMTLARWRGGEKDVWNGIERVSKNAKLPKRRRRFGTS